MEELQTPLDIIKALGGHHAVAKLTGSKAKAVWNWTESFPSNTYVAITDALHAIDKTAPDALWRMKAPAEAAQ